VAILPQQRSLPVVRAQRLCVILARLELPLVAALHLLELHLADRPLAELSE
jgi:hypothetical protein